MGDPCYSIVRKPKGFETSNEITIKRRIEGEDLEDCQTAIEELLQNLIDGEKFPTNLMMPVINRYQMNKFGGGSRGKRVTKLLYMLWEDLPKRGPDGRFLDRMVMVCGAFDKDLRHPNQYVCGSVLRTLSKTREPEVIQHLVHSIVKCLEWSHAYQRKNAVLAIAKIHKNFPELIQNTPTLIAEYLLKEKDDECKRAALQALLEIAPEEARSYLHSCNINDIHCMNASIQLLFVELIHRLFKKEESQDYINILKNLITSSSSFSVRYQAAMALMKFARRDLEAIRLAANCFINICAKDSDNNVKWVVFDDLSNLHRNVSGAQRVLRESIMDILSILQSATDLELHEKILELSLKLISPLNVGPVVTLLKQEINKMQDNNVLGSPQETAKYRILLVDTVHKIADRFPNAIVEHEMINSLFDLLISPSVGERTSSKLINLFKVFMTNNPNHQGIVVDKIQKCFNLAKECSATHRGLIQLLGDFSETKEEIEKSYQVIKDSLGPLPIVKTEKQKALQSNGGGAGDDSAGQTASSMNGDVDAVTKSMNRLVTADGSYATQSAINYQQTGAIGEEVPPLRFYFLRNKFETASVLGYALLKMAYRYQDVEPSKSENHKMIARFLFIIASILNLGHSNLVDQEGNPICMNNDHTENLLRIVNILQILTNEPNGDVAKLMKKIVTTDMRAQLALVVKNIEEERSLINPSKESSKKSRFDDRINIPLLSSRDDDLDIMGSNGLEAFTDQAQQISMPDMFGEIPLTGTIDPIYAYCEIDVNQYDIGLKIHLENRTQVTYENVTLELAARGDGSSNLINRPEPIVLAPRSSACIVTNVKVVSAENRRLFGSIAFDHTASDDREQVIMLNDININITDYIKPSSISFDDFRDVWRDSEWENKVTVKTKLTNLKEYLNHLVVATNMRCVTSKQGLSGDCSFLSANLYAKSSFGEDALVNVSIEKESPSAVVTGNVKIRSRSQGMALSLGEKITAAQNAANAI